MSDLDVVLDGFVRRSVDSIPVYEFGVDVLNSTVRKLLETEKGSSWEKEFSAKGGDFAKKVGSSLLKYVVEIVSARKVDAQPYQVYLSFLNHLSQNAGMPELMKSVGEKWGQLNDEAKHVYYLAAAELKNTKPDGEEKSRKRSRKSDESAAREKKIAKKDVKEESKTLRIFGHFLFKSKLISLVFVCASGDTFQEVKRKATIRFTSFLNSKYCTLDCVEEGDEPLSVYQVQPASGKHFFKDKVTLGECCTDPEELVLFVRSEKSQLRSGDEEVDEESSSQRDQRDVSQEQDIGSNDMDIDEGEDEPEVDQSESRDNDDDDGDDHVGKASDDDGSSRDEDDEGSDTQDDDDENDNDEIDSTDGNTSGEGEY